MGWLKKYREEQGKIITPERDPIIPISDPTTPLPAINAAAIEHLKQQMQQNRFTYERPISLHGIDACYTALRACRRERGIISTRLWVPTDCMKEVKEDTLDEFGIFFKGYIPYFHNNRSLTATGEMIVYIMKIYIFEDVNMPGSKITCMLP